MIQFDPEKFKDILHYTECYNGGFPAEPGWFLVAAFVEEGCDTEEGNQYDQNGQYRSVRVVKPWKRTRLLYGRHKEDIFEDYKKRLKESAASEGTARALKIEIEKQLKKVESDFSECVKTLNDTRVVLEKARKECTELREINKKYESDIQNVRKGIGEIKMKEILSEVKNAK